MDRFEHRDYRETLIVGPRNRRPVTDDLLIIIAHNSFGLEGSVLLDRSAVVDLHAWLGRWLASGWPERGHGG